MGAIGIIEMRKGYWDGLIKWLFNEKAGNGELYQMSLHKLLGYLCQDSLSIQTVNGLQLSTLSIANVNDYVGLIFDFVMENVNQLFAQYPTLIRVLVTHTSIALFNSPLCSSEALDDSRIAAVEGISALFKQLNLQAVNNQHGNAEVQVSAVCELVLDIASIM
ncbi:MAG: hypothetical protein EZS28_043047 [Streblomastix strix]|uniref:Uncharacterized protein n=1 Tax=Streblomastix strix TaxID=222440 RepID=A0A5J4TS95_9EUKA|nr:MAG: hypothetical protein EZS28_043047 [Streblomastix strix]